MGGKVGIRILLLRRIRLILLVVVVSKNALGTMGGVAFLRTRPTTAPQVVVLMSIEVVIIGRCHRRRWISTFVIPILAVVLDELWRQTLLRRGVCPSWFTLVLCYYILCGSLFSSGVTMVLGSSIRSSSSSIVIRRHPRPLDCIIL